MRPPTDLSLLASLLAPLPLSVVIDSYADLVRCPDTLDRAVLNTIDDKARAVLDDCMGAVNVLGQMLIDAREAGREAETIRNLDGAIRTVWTALLMAEQARSIALAELAKRAGGLQ